MAASSTSPVLLFQGSDEIVLGEAVRTAAHEALGDQPADLALEDLDESRYEHDGDYSIAPLVDAAQTPPFLTDRRVVIGRHLARFSTQDSVVALVRYLDDPLPTTTLILVWDKGPKLTQRVGGVPKKLLDALKAIDAPIVKTDIGTGRAAQAWLTDRLKASSVTLDAAAKRTLSDHLGDDANRLGGILAALESSYGSGAKLTTDEIEPFLGSTGSVPPWELTDAMASGDIASSLDKLRRMSQAGGRHPLATLATLTTHYQRMMRLDGADVRGEKDAALLLGMKGSTFPAKKAMQQSRTLGSERLQSAIDLIARADLALRGTTALDGEAVLEVLVARLARLSR